MRLLNLLCVSLALTACGNGTSIDPTSPRFLYKGLRNVPDSHREAALLDSLNSFLIDASSHGIDAQGLEPRLRVLGFQDGLSQGNMPPIKGSHSEGPSPVGVCITAAEVNPMNKKKIATHLFIYFDSSLKESIGTPYFKAIAYHEFAHCLLGRHHGEPLDLKDVRSPGQRVIEEMDARAANAEAPLSGPERDELQQKARHEFFDEIAERHDIMSPGLYHDSEFWTYKWDEMVEKLFSAH